MIINLNRCEDIRNIKMDLTNLVPCLYFLFSVDDKTPRYTRSRGVYFPDPKGNYVIDRGIDIMNRVPRILKYIGEGNTVFTRLMDHYRFDKSTIDIKKKGLDIKGVGPVFNYIRIIKGFIRFNYDTVRIHHETLCVRKYLPEINKSSKLNKNQKLIILNSAGTVSPYDLMIPYNIHARDIFRAYQAWLTEDMEYIKKEFVPYKMENSAGLIRPDKKNPQLYRKKGVKLKFSYWFTTAVLRYHKKQREAYVDFCKRQHKFIKLYDPFRYEEKIRRDTISSTLRRKNNSDEKKQFRRLTVKINRNKSRNRTINQPELL
jgi:hypothetical protein